mgnify:CR=1 FL=1
MVDKIILPTDVVEMAAFAKAMSHPVRVYILKKLSEMNTCCYSGDLVDELPVGRSALSQHLAVLRKDGLVKTRRESQTIYYSLSDVRASKVINTLHELYCS